MTTKLLGQLAVLFLAAAGAVKAEAKVKVVASFSILADITENIGGDDIEMVSIVGPESDAHAYAPKPDDVKSVADADLVVVNGLGFEGWQQRLMAASGFSKQLVTATDGVHTLASDDEDSNGVNVDPHAWQNMANVSIYVANIAKGLCMADHVNCPQFESRAAAYSAKLSAVDADIRAMLGTIRKHDRVIITSHDAFSYFADTYGLTVLAPEGISTDSDASAKDVAALIRQIRSENAKALFLENISDPRLLGRIASETGLAIGGTLYSDALSDSDGPASTYIDMMRHNAAAITTAILRK